MNAIWIAVAAVSLLGLAFGAILGYASRRFAVEDDPVVEKIDILRIAGRFGKRQQFVQRKTNPRHHHRPRFHAAHTINTLFQREATG